MTDDADPENFLPLQQSAPYAVAAAANGARVRWLDLGTVDTDKAPGLARFKPGTGAVLRRSGATCLVLP